MGTPAFVQEALYANETLPEGSVPHFVAYEPGQKGFL